ncbi:multifunctional oxoglutarate decarboxylase/oxoglutarate dehydrogenase thiamine pyrophosphate-binding subunit/dihydrolipoyllysine-residue succinyltransferase subunit [Nakamurella sp.]|uniref:multifunctional oxoglutarate decarboxylase/oxoglutarate dehydrogenase thiamine pyrophosphate-binding subunit/dihydrolipoyllysine-residue succinyltransferase subunit n=1 Tax=Nakamurella sp. TaxID=1869182 RepID=UPI003B3B21A1
MTVTHRLEPRVSTSLETDFGPNDWFVQEKYEEFLADPASVDSIWRDFFAAGPGANRVGPSAAVTPAATTSTPAPAPSVPAAARVPPAAAPSRSDAGGAAPDRSAPDRSAPAAVSGGAAGSVAALRGASAAVVKNMTASLDVPTATSVRAVPAKLMADNRLVINNFLRRNRGGKISFTHLVGYAIVRAVADFPTMNRSFTLFDGKPAARTPDHVNLGLAIDLPGRNGTRNLVVVPIKAAEAMTFAQFWTSYELVVRKARTGALAAEDYADTTITLTNPGGIGTNHSVPRLMSGQSAIIGVGALEYPAEFQGASEQTLADLAISKIITLTSTYDHRVIQGAESGEFLKRIHQLLLGADGFYDDIFTSLRLPYEPVRWVPDLGSGRPGGLDRTARVLGIIDAYRTRGHLMADTDPLHYRQRRHPDLDIITHGLTLWDLDREFPVGGFADRQHMRLRDVLGVLRDAYCRTVGVEYAHILDPEQRQWLQERVESPRPQPTVAEQQHILGRLNSAEAFETFLQTKYIGQKRFSLEGGETVIPLLDAALQQAVATGADEVVIGMAHRGRLNVLANIVGKPSSQIFREFEGNMDPKQTQGSGDVKYHLGAEGRYRPPAGQGSLAVTLVANPSHLEVVDPVLEGVARARQDQLNLGERGYTVLPVAIHGDAAFAGQGVVAETLQLSQLRGYRTGGTLHVIINNQVGFTTAPESSRSSVYCTDVAKMVQAPIFHVNGDDPEAATWVARLAVDYRQRFGGDVVIDMICYRRRGHNEGDDPSMTNPLMYQVIDGKRSVRRLYTEALIGRGDLSVAEAEDSMRDYQAQLDRTFREVRELERAVPHPSPSVAADQPVPHHVDTTVDAAVLRRVADAALDLPAGFVLHPRVKSVLERRVTMARDGDIDWAFAELAALGSLAMGGRLVRFAGQDTRRGTFVQRHAVVVDHATGAEYQPLQHLTPDQARVLIYDSALTEYAALGFEYGYSVADPDALVLWEAQFGDFVNGAQSIIDEYLSSGEAKWGQRSGVVLLLPHGHEGQGPDHTSGRIERFLQLCAEDSMTVAVPSTPANYFHLLRHHTLDGVHRPLIVFTPKSMLRNKAAVSPVADFTGGGFRPVIADDDVDPTAVTTLLVTSGKFFYELAAHRAATGITDTAIVRLEQLYPVPHRELDEVLQRYPAVTEIRWVQEEPANQGAWSFLALVLPDLIPRLSGLHRISRRPMAAPSAGSAQVHRVEQTAVVTAAFARQPTGRA